MSKDFFNTLPIMSPDPKNAETVHTKKVISNITEIERAHEENKE